MIIFTILVAGAMLFGALTMYAFGSYVEHRGYIRGLKEAEEIMRDVRNERHTEYKKWETPPKLNHQEIITTCMGVPMALIEDEPQKEGEVKE